MQSKDGPVEKPTTQYGTSELARWQKYGILLCVVILSVLPIYCTYKAAAPDVGITLWSLRHVVSICIIQLIAQISICWYILKYRVPSFAVLGYLVMVLSFQVVYGVAIIFMSNA
ncbi:hypothetical protein FHS30_000345 [Simiduia aestuariiviva]|uniref:Uncharacterized protein n=1 Tax=Simiduia aestuariiviva TaxID=1510459 RepID=A0A839UKQ8_9GAMM|nr:hypothetical protein [Simiduia aestuariiviva]